MKKEKQENQKEQIKKEGDKNKNNDLSFRTTFSDILTKEQKEKLKNIYKKEK